MKKQWTIRALLLIVYCVPFAFLSVNGDATLGTMLFYGVMIVGFALLCWSALKTNNIAVLYIGNGLSFLSSYTAGKLSGLEPMGHYFKRLNTRVNFNLLLELILVSRNEPLCYP